jgi:hypothetical protein
MTSFKEKGGHNTPFFNNRKSQRELIISGSLIKNIIEERI